MVSDTQLYKRHKHIMHVGTAIIIEIYATILGSSLFAEGDNYDCSSCHVFPNGDILTNPFQHQGHEDINYFPHFK